MDNYLDLLKLVLPPFLVEHFDLIKSRKKKEVLHLYFEERNNPPQEHSTRLLVSKGFHKEVTIQDFPLRGNTVYLHLKRRRWIDKDTSQLVQRDWNLVAQGTRITTGFAAFLKEISQYEGV
ncbi:transposase [Zunongwangia sp. H14]|uniref:ISAon1 family transposase N-terminal region protein n=1 Tax=Zunongwangia sp. H14 TaxID=3240792 RepID=UPI003566C398